MDTITVTEAGSAVVSEGPVTTAPEIDVATPVSIVHVSIPNQPVQVQSVIQGAQPSVIQTAGGTIQTIQVSVGIVMWSLKQKKSGDNFGHDHIT